MGTGWNFIVLKGDNATPSYPNSGMGGGVFAYGSASQVKGNNKTAPSAGPDGNPGNCLAFFGVWGCGGYYYQEVTFQPELTQMVAWRPTPVPVVRRMTVGKDSGKNENNP